MSQHVAGSTAQSSSNTSSRTLRRGGFVAAVAALALTVPTSPATAQALPTTTAPAAVVTIAPKVTLGQSSLASGTWRGRFTQAKYERRMHLWMNRQRVDVGARRVGVRTCIDGFAERWAQYLKETDSFYHQDLGGVMTNCRQSQAGEILAKGNVTPYQMVRMWMASPDHRRLMLSRDYGDVGISARRNASGTWIGCIDFGRP